MNTKGKGTIEIQTKEGQKHVQEILLVPDLEQNLVSVSQLVEHGYSVHFENGGCVIYDKGQNGKIIKFIKMEENKKFSSCV